MSWAHVFETFLGVFLAIIAAYLVIAPAIRNQRDWERYVRDPKEKAEAAIRRGGGTP